MERISIGNHKYLKTLNKNTILDAIKDNGPICRSEIANLTKLGGGTITKFTNELIAEKLIKEERNSVPSGGRRSSILKINPEAGFIIGADLGASTTKVVITDLASRVIFKKIAGSRSFQTKERIIQGFLETIEETIKESAVEKKRVKFIGLSLSGTVDPEKGILISAGNLGIPYGTNIKINEVVGNKFDFPVYSITTAGAAALGEKKFGLGKGIENMVCLCMGMGIGSGIISHNQLVMDKPEKRVGYIGHILIDKNGPLCGCGKRGCLEAYAGGRAIAREAKKTIKENKSSLIRDMADNNPEKVTAEMVGNAARAGDRLALEILERAAGYIAKGVIHLIQIYHPERIILNGGFTKCGEPLLSPLTKEIERVISKDRFDVNNIFLTSLGDFGSALGATLLAYTPIGIKSSLLWEKMAVRYF